jgi:hypothetical protein
MVPFSLRLLVFQFIWFVCGGGGVLCVVSPFPFEIQSGLLDVEPCSAFPAGAWSYYDSCWDEFLMQFSKCSPGNVARVECRSHLQVTLTSLAGRSSSWMPPHTGGSLLVVCVCGEMPKQCCISTKYLVSYESV